MDPRKVSVMSSRDKDSRDHLDIKDMRAYTIHEEVVPVIVRRRGCMLSVRITAFGEEGPPAGRRCVRNS